MGLQKLIVCWRSSKMLKLYFWNISYLVADDHSDIFDKINTLLDDVDITATTKIIESTTKATTIKSQGNFNFNLITLPGASYKI